jgi:outer membrane protein
MLPKISIGISLLSLFVVLFFVIKNEDKKIAFANTEKLVYSYKGMQEAHDAYNLKQQQMKGDLEKLNMEYKMLIQKFQEEEKTLSDKKKKEQIQKIRHKEMELKNMDEHTKAELQQLDQNTTKGVLNQVDAMVKKYAEENGYDLVFGGNDGNILYGHEVLDITDDLIKYSNNNFEIH